MTNKTLSEKICEVCGIEPHEVKYCFWECKNPQTNQNKKSSVTYTKIQS